MRIIPRVLAGERCGLSRVKFSDSSPLRRIDINRTYVLELAREVVQAEQKFMPTAPGRSVTEATDDTIWCTVVLDLDGPSIVAKEGAVVRFAKIPSSSWPTC